MAHTSAPGHIPTSGHTQTLLQPYGISFSVFELGVEFDESSEEHLAADPAAHADLLEALHEIWQVVEDRG